MSKHDKRLWLGIGLTVILILLLLSRRSSAASVVNETDGSTINVEVPAFNLPPRTPINISLPQMPGMPAYDFSMVSGCMCGNDSAVSSYSGGDQTYNFTNYQVSQFTQTNPVKAPFTFYGAAAAAPAATYGTYDAFGNLHGGNSGNDTPWW